MRKKWTPKHFRYYLQPFRGLRLVFCTAALLETGGYGRKQKRFSLEGRRQKTPPPAVMERKPTAVFRNCCVLIVLGQMDLDRVQAEVEAKVAAEHQNEDIVLRKIRAQVTSA